MSSFQAVFSFFFSLGEMHHLQPLRGLLHANFFNTQNYLINLDWRSFVVNPLNQTWRALIPKTFGQCSFLDQYMVLKFPDPKK